MYLLLLFASLTLVLPAQKNRIDEFFSRYEGTEGFTSITINGDLFGLIAKLDEEDEELRKLANKVTSIRIVSTESDRPRKDVDFYSELVSDIRKGGYEEMITVKSSDDNVLILVKTSGNIISEVLIVASGEDQAVIQIRGKLNQDDLDNLSRSHVEGLHYLEELEKSGK